MSATREYRNMGAIEDALAAVGAAITVAQHLADALSSVLPDDAPPVEMILHELRIAHEQAQEALGV